MPTVKTMTEYDYHEFEQLAIRTFGLPPDYSVVAQEEWSNDSQHSFTADVPDAFEQEQLVEFMLRIDAYRVAVAANGGIDADANFSADRHDLTPTQLAVRAARIELWTRTSFNTHLLFTGLVHAGVIVPGEYLIAVCW